MSVPELLLNSLEEMNEENFKKFKFYLGSRAIPEAQLEQADRTDTVNKIIQCYTTEGAVEATVTILRRQRMNELAENLLKAEKSSGTSSKPSSSGVTPATAAPSYSAKDGGAIIAPSDPGTWNITLNKN